MRSPEQLTLPLSRGEYSPEDQSALRRAIEHGYQLLRNDVVENRNYTFKQSSLALRRHQFLLMGAGQSSDGGAGLTQAEVDARVVVGASGVQTEFIRPSIGSTSSGASVIDTAGQSAVFKAILFPNNQYGQFHFAWTPPKRWDGGQYRFRYFWSPTNTNTGDVEVGLYGQGFAQGDITTLSGTGGVAVVDTPNGTADDLHVSDWSAWTNFSSMTGSPADDELIFMRLQRNAPGGNDLFTGSLELYLAELQWVSDTPTDD